MNYKTKNKRLALSLVSVSIFIFAAFTSSAFAIGTAMEAMETMDTMDTLSGAQSKSRPSRRPAKRNSPQENLQTEDRKPDPARDTSEQYGIIIGMINKGQPIPSRLTSQLLQELKARQISVGRLDTTTLTKHYVLVAWLNYFNNDIKRAQQSSRLAFKKNAWSKDAQLTQTAIAILAGTKPSPLPKEPVTQTTSYDTFDSYNHKSEKRETAPEMFNLDVDRIDTGLIGAKIKEMKLNCLNSTSLEYNYGTDDICILLWKLPNKLPTPSRTSYPKFTTDPNVPAFQPMAAKYNYNNEDEDEYPNKSYSGRSRKEIEKPKSGFSDSINAYKKLFSSTMGLSNIKFVAVNMDTARSKPKVLAAILQNSWPWAHVMLNDPQSNASQFKGVVLEENTPLLLIAGKDGTIIYAGPATDFLAPMVVSQISNPHRARSSFANIFKSNPTSSRSANTAPATTAGNPNTTSQKSRFITDKQPTKMSLEDEFQAGKLLENAKMLIRAGSRYMTPKRGIEICRQLIGDYPGTKYADEARLLLRKVPERYRKRYNLTSDELGL